MLILYNISALVPFHENMRSLEVKDWTVWREGYNSMYNTCSSVHPYLKVLILLLRQRFLGHHQRPQAFPGHVPTLTERRGGCYVNRNTLGFLLIFSGVFF